MVDTVIHLMLTLLMPPLLLGVINRTKAVFAGRKGQPYLQVYLDLVRLMRKGSTFSETTTWVFRAGPVITLAAIFCASLLIPLGNHMAPISFAGDMVLFAYLFGLARFFTMTAALDTGSSFEGMGAAREATFACLTEPTIFFTLVVLCRLSGSLSLSGMLTHFSTGAWFSDGTSILLLIGALYMTLLAENCRIPFDDPNTHLELTMIHEVMVLDHSGPAFGYILYAASLKLFVLSAFFAHVAIPFSTGNALVDWAIFAGSLILIAISIGIVESTMARLRLTRIPQILVGGAVLSGFAMLLNLR